MNGDALVFLGGAEASASPSFALPMFITIKKIIILHLILGVPAATVGGTGTPWHTRGYAPDMNTEITRQLVLWRLALYALWLEDNQKTQNTVCLW